VLDVPKRAEDPELVRERRIVFGTRLRQLRKWRGLTAEQLAEQAQLHRTYVVRLENGQVSPGFDSLWALADALELRLADLVGDEWPEGWPATPPAWPTRPRRPREG
jgi:transcriptional regulator with XRE-family HTH domain